MAIAGFSQDEFQQILRENLTPARPVSSPEQLRGRSANLRQIDRAFNSQGRHVFIFGDRGVGKTSLAQAAAVMHQSADQDPIIVACDSSSGFFRITKDILQRCMPPRDAIQKWKKSEGFKANAFGLSYELVNSIENGVIAEAGSINDVINSMRFVAQFHSKSPVVIIDEFDQIKEDSDRKHFADLIKQISDQGINVRLIFCGIGSSLDALIGVHLSTDRYLTPIRVDRLTHDARWEIISNVAEKLNVHFDDEYLFRIGQISDGFPYYVHLIGETILWSIFDDEKVVRSCNSKHYQSGLKGAINEAVVTLKFAYDRATQKYSDDYQEVLWAVADTAILRRQVTEIYEKSYERIMDLRPSRKRLDKVRFLARMNTLKSERHGEILMARGAGWYEFRENVVRGYVRLRAEEQGIRLGMDHHPVGG